MNPPFTIGIDLGGTKIEAALINKQGGAFGNIQIPTSVMGGPSVITNQIIHLIDSLKKLTRDEVIGIGLGVPGQVSSNNGTVLFAPNLNWENVPLQETLAEKTHLPIAITNDVRAATWGEWLHGAGKGSQDIVCLFVGTGVGSGIVSDGHMLRGFNNSAGELGHTIIQMEGALCTCGSKGCLEALASGWAIAKKARQLIENNHEAGNKLLDLAEGKKENVTAKMIIKAYHEKNLLAEEIIVGVFHALTVGCINIANTFNPERLILGGGILSSLPEVLEHVREGTKKYALRSASRDLMILPAKLTHNSGVIGAGTLAWKTFIRDEK